MCFQFNASTYCNRQQNAASTSSSVLSFQIWVQVPKIFYDVPQERETACSAAEVFSLLDIMQPTPPFAFYLHVSLKTKENRNFKALFSLSDMFSKSLNWTPVTQQFQKQVLQAWHKGIPCPPSAFVLTGMDGSCLQIWNDRKTVKRKQRWTKWILDSNIYKVIFKTQNE